jgi:hypothetical protein
MIVKSAPAMARVEPPLSEYLSRATSVRASQASLKFCIRVEAMLAGLAAVLLGSIGEGVVGPIHERVLAEHGSHDCGFEIVNRILGFLE